MPVDTPVTSARLALLERVKDQTEVVALVNSKGGVGKTSISVNAASIAARGGLKVLLLDLDLNGSMALELGLTHRGVDDEGEAFAEAVWKKTALPIVHNVRENLDVVIGGAQLELLEALGNSSRTSPYDNFLGLVAAIASDYDYIFVDCAPGSAVLQQMALTIAHWVLIPTKTEAGSWKGIRGLSHRIFKMVEENRNPWLEYLGVVIFAHNPSATTVEKQTRRKLSADLGNSVPLFNSVIRTSEALAKDSRDRGQTALEVAKDANAAPAWYEVLRNGADVTRSPRASAKVADSLAGDYLALTQEILLAIQQRTNEEAGE